MRPTAVRCAVVGALLLGACDKQDAKADEKSASSEPDDAKADDDPKADEKEATFAKPNIEPPPAPEGSLTLADPWLYVQTCAEPHTCPELLQPAGDAHCRELQLGGHVNWRLPSREEVPRFRGVEGLEARAGYHWTRTPDAENPKFAWLVDPEDKLGTPELTTPRDRKPFRIRCVKEP